MFYSRNVKTVIHGKKYRCKISSIKDQNKYKMYEIITLFEGIIGVKSTIPFTTNFG